MHQLQTRRTTLNRRGFTLLEVVLALGLTVVLMAAIYGALNLYWRFSSAGREQMERAQLARTLLAKIAADIRSVVYTEPPPANETATAGSTGGSSSSSNSGGNSSASSTSGETTQVASMSDNALRTSTGIVGTSFSLSIDLTRASKELMIQLVPSATDQRAVTWFLGTPTGTFGGPGLSSAVAGLARQDGERLVISSAAATGSQNLLAAQTAVLAPEVNYLQFRYFDGLIWLTSWDTTVTGYLPQAVEITIGLNSPRETMPRSFGLNTPKEVYRLVVAVPLADRYRLQKQPLQ